MTAVGGVPALTAPRAGARLASTTEVLENGLTVVAVRKVGIPLVELRLRIPFLSAEDGHPARAGLLAETVLTGAGDMDRAGLAATIQALGGSVSAGVDADRLVFSGNVLATNLARLLQVIATVMTEPSYERDEIDAERERLIERLTMAMARPAVIASEALAHRMFGDHPYAIDLPRPEDVATVQPTQVRALHRRKVRPGGAALVLVGDLRPARMIEQARAALAGWTGSAPKARVPALPTPPGGAVALVDRPGAVQSSLRLARMAVGRTDPGYPGLYLANLIFGGYFTSRWTENIREDKGYTYGPHSRVEHHALGSTLGLSVEVQSEVTAPAVLETLYELGRIATLPVTEKEVRSVQQYAIGTLALSTATQAGLASMLSALAGHGLGLDWLAQFRTALQAATVADVSAAAAQFFAPAGFTSVVVGDSSVIAESLAALVSIER